MLFDPVFLLVCLLPACQRNAQECSNSCENSAKTNIKYRIIPKDLKCPSLYLDNPYFEIDLQEPGSIASTRMQAFAFGIKVNKMKFLLMKIVKPF